MVLAIVTTMAITSMQVDPAVRDELALVAQRDFGGASLGEALRRLLIEYRVRRVLERYEQLQADPAEWAEYRAEIDEWDVTVADGLGPADGSPR